MLDLFSGNGSRKINQKSSNSGIRKIVDKSRRHTTICAHYLTQGEHQGKQL